MAPTVILAKAGIQFFRSPAWMPACAGMTNWVALVAAYGAHVHLAHISPDLASPEGEGFQPSPKGTLKRPIRFTSSTFLVGRMGETVGRPRGRALQIIA